MDLAAGVPETNGSDARLSPAFASFLLSAAVARAFAEGDPALAARTLSEWIGTDG